MTRRSFGFYEEPPLQSQPSLILTSAFFVFQFLFHIHVMSFHSVPTSARGHILSADFHNDADCSCYHQSSPNALSIEIPDSQEDTAPSPDLEAQPHAESPLGPQKVNDSEVSSSKSSSGDTEINTEYSAPEIEVEYRFVSLQSQSYSLPLLLLNVRDATLSQEMFGFRS